MHEGIHHICTLNQITNVIKISHKLNRLTDWLTTGLYEILYSKDVHEIWYHSEKRIMFWSKFTSQLKSILNSRINFSIFIIRLIIIRTMRYISRQKYNAPVKSLYLSWKKISRVRTILWINFSIYKLQLGSSVIKLS